MRRGRRRRGRVPRGVAGCVVVRRGTAALASVEGVGAEDLTMVHGGARRRSERWRVVRGFEREQYRAETRTWYVETVPSRLPVAACEAREDARLLVRTHNEWRKVVNSKGRSTSRK